MKKLIILSILLTTLSCGLNNKGNNDKKSEKNSVEKVRTSEQEVKEMVELWNKASSNGDFIVLENMLADKVEYYQQTVTRDYYIKDQKKFFEKNPVYGQVIKGDINIQQISDTQYKAEFVKEVTTKKGTKDYPSYLVFKKIGDEWKLILESDTVSDANIEKRKKQKTESPNKSTYYYGDNQTLIGTFDIKKIFVKDGAANENGKTIYPYFLFLSSPIKVVPSVANDSENVVETGVTELHLVLDENLINYLKSNQAYGKKVKMTGELFHSQTIHHQSAVLMNVKNIEILN
ncbi:hypothetical protein HMPREF3180_01811 [Leptotrichia wadei]|jgi:hypothetical protein|uniref:DUF4431 domain-containing protein n=1 Tax=Leptotrichia wadei TaxID=157687 RepID=A0A134A188_9FUSO|nr:DUF4431 domain-containing protein [Leptotrichia wadei]KXB61441.1 hypothetical protein HMPREF3180_01811 [Leptotrichia wadei]